MLVAAERATLKQLIDQANMPCWKDGWTDSKGNKKRGFWYVYFDCKKHALGKFGAPSQRGGTPDGPPGRNEFKEAVAARNAFLTEWVRKRAKEYNKQQADGPPVVRVVDCLNYYTEHHLSKVKNTEERTRYCVIFATGRDGGAHGIRPYKGFGKLPLERLEGHHLDQWIAAHPNWTYPGRRKAVNVVKAAINYFVDKHSRSGIVNPIRDYRVEKGDDQPTERRPMCSTSEEEVAIRRCASRAYRVFFSVSRDTGARPGELAIATPGHLIETGNGGVAIRLSPQEWKNGLRHKTPQSRIIPLPRKWQRYVLKRKRHCAPNAVLFPNTQGQAWTQASWSKAFKDARAAANIDGEVVRVGLRPYSTRHTFITQKLIAGMKNGIVDIERRLAKACGTSVEEIRKTYDHVIHDFQQIEEVMNI